MPTERAADAAPSPVKFLFVTGGVTSSLGKGIVSASWAGCWRRAGCA